MGLPLGTITPSRVVANLVRSDGCSSSEWSLYGCAKSGAKPKLLPSWDVMKLVSLTTKILYLLLVWLYFSLGTSVSNSILSLHLPLSYDCSFIPGSIL